MGARHLPVLLRLAAADVGRRPWRLGFLAAGIALACAASLGSLVFHASIHRSLDRNLDRMGADAVVLPAGVTANLTPLLLTVEPGSALLGPGAVERVGAFQAVDRVAPQRTLRMADTAGHLPTELVVFDPASDLTVLPWVVESIGRPFGPGDIIAGGRRPERVGERLVLQGVEATVHGKLGLAGAGPFERSLFIGPDTADRLASAGAVLADGQPFPANSLETPSGVLVRLGRDRGPEELRFAAASEPGLTVHTGPGSQVAIRQSVESLSRGSLATLAVALVAPAVLVGVAYAGMLAERRRELGTLLALGVPRRHIVLTVATEAGLAALAGVLAGSVVAFGIIAAFLRTFGFALEQRSITLALPPAWECAWYCLASGAAVAGTAVAGAALATWLASASQPWTLLRGDGP